MFERLDDGSREKAIYILYAQEVSQSHCSQGDCIVFLNLRYVCTFLEVARPTTICPAAPWYLFRSQRSVPLGQLMQAYF